MSTLDLLSSAIINKTPISFTYPKPGKVLGIRIGNPHAVYKFTTKEGVITTKVHIWQTGGVSDTGESIPDWRNFDINYIEDVKLLSEHSPFKIADGYNPDYYDDNPAIIKI